MHAIANLPSGNPGSAPVIGVFFQRDSGSSGRMKKFGKYV